MPLPPEVAKGTTVFPVKSYASMKVSMIDGSRYHQIGKPTKTTSYCAMFSTRVPIAGRALRSFISRVLRLFLSIQFRSAFVYGTSAAISYRSAPVTAASFSDSAAVVPLALK